MNVLSLLSVPPLASNCLREKKKKLVIVQVFLIKGVLPVGETSQDKELSLRVQ